jgi:hypothetical protein
MKQVFSTYRGKEGGSLGGFKYRPLCGTQFAEPLPEMALEADEHIIERYGQTKLEWGLAVDPDFARGGNR